jgi:hypothetical protein
LVRSLTTARTFLRGGVDGWKDRERAAVPSALRH